MELYEEILLHAVRQAKHSINADQVMRDTCCRALCEIKAILENDHMTDTDCFWRIEEIVRIFEELGSDAGNRHDFS